MCPGGEHTLALTSNDLVFSWGSGQCGRLGHGDDQDRDVPTLVAPLQRCVSWWLLLCLVSLSCILRHRRSGVRVCEPSCCRSTPAFRASHVCACLCCSVKVTHIAAGLAHSLVTSRSGRVFSFGWGEYGQLGLGDDADVWTPTQVAALNSVKVAHAAAGAQHSCFMSRDGELFTCGKATRGRLGHGDKRRRQLPEQVMALDPEAVVHVAASASAASAGGSANPSRALHRWLSSHSGATLQEGARPATPVHAVTPRSRMTAADAWGFSG